MRRHLTDDERLDRASLDGRVAFAAAAFGLGAALIVLLDRIGLPENAAVLLGFILGVALVSTIGVLLRSVRISSFYAAAHAIPASYAGLAGAGAIAAIALILWPPLPVGLSVKVLGFGLLGGILGLGLVSAPLLRKSGAFSVSDLFATRFPGLIFRCLVILVIVPLCVLTAAAGFETSIQILGTQLGVARPTAALVTGIILLVAIVPGGLAGSVWTAAAGGGMLVAGLVLPLIVLAGRGTDVALPYVGTAGAFEHGIERAGAFLQDFGAGQSAGWLAVPLAFGLIGFAPLLSNSIACRDRRGAQHMQVAMTGWLVVVFVALAATLATTAIGIDLQLLGQRPDRLADSVYRASADGFLDVCGRSVPGPAQARAACAAVDDFAAVIRPSDIAVAPQYLLFGLSQSRGLGGAFAGFAAVGWFVVCLALAGAGLQGVATALGHDLVYRIRDRRAITSRRLATTRLVLILSIIAVTVGLARHGADQRVLIGAALLLSGVAVTPLMLLSLWPRAGTLEATLTLAFGVGSALAVLLYSSAEATARLGEAGLTGLAVGLAVGFLVSLRPGAAAAPGTPFVDSLLHGTSDALAPDKGA